MNMTELCQELKNYFLRDKNADIHTGAFKVENGNISASFLLPGQYFRIVGSVLNDGVYKYPATDLVDESFTGAVWAMAVPPAVVQLAADIAKWQTDNAAAVNSPYQSESFGGYSYTLKSGANGSGVSWQSQFRSRLNAWRRISVL